MALPFSHDQFLDAFARYNFVGWPWVAALWLATAVGLAAWLRPGSPAIGRVAALLTAHWLTSTVYFVALFRSINRRPRCSGGCSCRPSRS